jgi:alpha-methylacyl-CoA racemase
MPTEPAGPLTDVTVVELAGIGPGPYAGMVLADMGARVIKVDRVGGAAELFPGPLRSQILDRGKRRIEIDLKADAGRHVLMSLLAVSDALIEGFRPGVTERLEVGPAEALAVNPALVYGRITGWGQTGPLASTAGHDIDYIAVAGALGSIGGEDPEIPLNLVADFGGGGMFLVCGLLAGVIAARSTGVGTVVDAAMVDGVAHLMSMMHGGREGGWWRDRRRSNVLDGAAPFYAVYRTADGEHMAVGALEPRFFAELIGRLGLEDAWLARQYDLDAWSDLRSQLEAAFALRTRDEWVGVFAGSDACVAPVMSISEAVEHPHLLARETFVDVDGVNQPAPAPRFSGYRATIEKPVESGTDTGTILADVGFSADRIAELRASGAIG